MKFVVNLFAQPQIQTGSRILQLKHKFRNSSQNAAGWGAKCRRLVAKHQFGAKCRKLGGLMPQVGAQMPQGSLKGPASATFDGIQSFSQILNYLCDDDNIIIIIP